MNWHMTAGCVVNKNLLIVESANDKFFIERLKCEINAANFDIGAPICNISDYVSLNGLSPEALELKFKDIKVRVQKEGLDKIGILLDADNSGIAARVALINDAVKCIDPSLDIAAVDTWYTSDALAVQISCHILNVAGSGELETLLKAIKSKPSPYADCLNLWRGCIESQGKPINNKEFDKFWISIYGRYDCCNEEEQKQAGRKCNLEASLQKDSWDFSHALLNDLKGFLMMFN